MDELITTAREILATAALYEVNGILVLLYVAWEHILAIITGSAFVALLAPAPEEQRPWITAAGGIGVLAAFLVAPPVPLILAAMAAAGAGAVYLDNFNPEALRWRVVGGLALYALAALAYLGYGQYLAGVDAAAWAAAIGGEGAAQATLARGQSFVNTLATWGLWLILPLGYFSLLVQGVLIHRPPQGRPDELVTAVRTRGEKR